MKRSIQLVALLLTVFMLQLNGQAVGIKAGYIGSLEALHVLLADDDILDDLIQRGTHVDIAVGIQIGRAHV